MSIVNLRDRRQITLPPDIVSAAGLQVNDPLEVSLINGVIQLVPAGKGRGAQRSISRFLGAAGGVYGQTAAEVDAYVREQRDSW
jgi:bifunctional DNA-binding transcriptional regulator/antitoxin component of YhaV-PrlF toxin-antitoxin module